jgi:hypothetical protein
MLYTILDRKLMKLRSIRTASDSIDLNSSERMLPFTFGFFGASSTGKTTVGKQFLAAIAHALELPYGDGHEFVVKEGMKHWDGFKNCMNMLIFDDYANKKNKANVESTNLLIDVVNRVPFHPPMAALEAKEAADCRPDMCLITGHHRDCNAFQDSVDPKSIQRRVQHQLRVKIRDRFAEKHNGQVIGISSQKVAEYYERNPEKQNRLVDDILTYSITIVGHVAEGKEGFLAPYETAWFCGKPMEDVSTDTALAYLIHHAAKHRRQEEEMMNRKTTFSPKDFPLCSQPKCKLYAYLCPFHVQRAVPQVSDVDPKNHSSSPGLVNQSLLSTPVNTMFAYGMNKMKTKVVSDVTRKVMIGEMGTKVAIYHGAERLWNNLDWLQFVPTWLVATRAFQEAAGLVDSDKVYDVWLSYIRSDIRKAIMFSFLFALFYGSMDVKFQIGYWTFAIYMMMGRAKANWIKSRQIVIEQMMARNDVSHICSTALRDKFMTQLGLYATGAGIIYLTLKAARAAKAAHGLGFEGCIDSVLGIKRIKQGNVGHTPASLPEKLPDVTEQSGEDSSTDQDQPIVHGPEEKGGANSEKSQWLNPVLNKICLTDKAKTMTSEQVINKIQKNLVYGIFADFETEKPTNVGDILYVHQNMIVFPKHYVRDMKKFKILCIRNDDPKATNHSYKLEVYPQMLYEIDDSDLVFVHCTSHGALCADIRHLFPMSPIPDDGRKNYIMTYRNKNGAIEESKGTGKCGRFKIEEKPAFHGLKYVLAESKCFPGLCGAVLSSVGNGSCIFGIHVAGSNTSSEGVAAQITQETIERAVDHFKVRMGFRFLAPVEPLRSHFAGNELPKAEGLHPKNFMNYQQKPIHMQLVGYGIPPQRNTTNFAELPIAATVAHEFDSYEIWYPAKMNPRWHGIQKWVGKASEPMKTFPPDLLQTAVDDYLKMTSVVSESERWKDKVTPLTLDQNLNGIPGRRFIPSLNINTSAGTGLSGKKKKYIDLEEGPGTRVLDSAVMKEYLEADERVRKGQRLGLPARMFGKDEAHAVDDKMRMIYLMNISLVLLVRKYLLPIIEMIELNPILFECCVGVNAGSQEWHELMAHVKSMGEERTFAGDYSGYDSKITPQLISAVFTILIKFARDLGYSETDILAIETLCAELTHPIVDIDGAYVLFSAGIWISGNPLTVILNSIANSILLRMYFFYEYPDKVYTDYVAVTTYGDDSKGTVKEGAPRFNPKRYAIWLESFGMKFTHPNKEDEIPEYYGFEEADFLKRNSVFHPDLGVEVGALDPKSMIRMLKCCILNRGNGLDTTDMSVENMGTSLGEAFLHGEEYYEDFRKKIANVAEKHKLTPHVQKLDYTYADRVREWIDNYGPRALNVIEREKREIPRAYFGGGSQSP